MEKVMPRTPVGLMHAIAATWAKILLGSVAASLLVVPARADETSPPAPAAALHQTVRAQFLDSTAPQTVRRVADWVTDSRDNHGLPFVIVDKKEAKVFVFDKDGKALGHAWALVGLAEGDGSVPGIGTMPLAQIKPEMRTTPAGRFVSSLGHDLGKADVLWVDYKDAISLHRVINTVPAERRLERIKSPSPAEHRISYGCINVPAKFFDTVIDPAFKTTHGITYILPEVKSLRAVFPAYYDVDVKSALQAAVTQPVPDITAAPVRYEEKPALVQDHDLTGIVH